MEAFSKVAGDREQEDDASDVMDAAATKIIDLKPKRCRAQPLFSSTRSITWIVTPGEMIGWPSEFIVDDADPDSEELRDIRSPEYFLMKKVAVCLTRLLSAAA